MIRINKGGKPDVLRRNAAAWTKELLEADDKPKAKGSRYGHQDVKAALIAETGGKCAYCESKFGHVAFGDVEHIVAKAVDPELAYEWMNLTIACDRCNTAKGDREGLLDPYNDDPAAHIQFLGPMLIARLGSELGRVTAVVLRLNRTELLERRKEKLDALRDNLEVVLKATDANRRQLLLSALLADATASSAEFSACLAEHVRVLRADGTLI